MKRKLLIYYFLLIIPIYYIYCYFEPSLKLIKENTYNVQCITAPCPPIQEVYVSLSGIIFIFTLIFIFIIIYHLYLKTDTYSEIKK